MVTKVTTAKKHLFMRTIPEKQIFLVTITVVEPKWMLIYSKSTKTDRDPCLSCKERKGQKNSIKVGMKKQ